jgi:hypothetical protein
MPQNLFVPRRKSKAGNTSDESTDRLAVQLSGESETAPPAAPPEDPAADPDLARIVAAWPDLPEPIRRAMLAMVYSVRG